MIPFVLHPEAQNELDELAEYFLPDLDLWLALESRYLHFLALIRGNPLLFHPRHHQVRRANLVPRFDEYYIAYLWSGERIVILAIGHAKRRPYYFRDRLKTAKELP